MDRQRRKLLLKATIRIDQTDHCVRIRDVSAGGIKIEYANRMPDSKRVDVHLPNVGWVTARVVWCAGSKAGLAFSAPVDCLRVRQTITGSYGLPNSPVPLPKKSVA